MMLMRNCRPVPGIMFSQKGMQSLPLEKMDQVVQIIRKMNGNVKQGGDEIEIVIEAVDTETLWELDRYVTNWKMMRKIKRQALLGTLNNNAAPNKSNGECSFHCVHLPLFY
ncbi:hypothetical protein S83_070689 [Arachis hypogaea]|nr:Transcription factor [Arachis hypogaea]